MLNPVSVGIRSQNRVCTLRKSFPLARVSLSSSWTCAGSGPPFPAGPHSPGDGGAGLGASLEIPLPRGLSRREPVVSSREREPGGSERPAGGRPGAPVRGEPRTPNTKGAAG